MSQKTLGEYITSEFGADFLSSVWSSKNQKTPDDYTWKSGKTAWFKCPNGIHEDKEKKIYNATNRGFRCFLCEVEKAHKKQMHDLTGQRFGKLVVKRLDSDRNAKEKNTYWICDCDCGTKGKSVGISNLTGGKTLSCGCNKNLNSGSKHYNWKGGVTSDDQKDRNGNKTKQWRQKVFEKDNYTCQCCLSHGSKLNAHHILNFSSNKNLRYDLSNGITLCESCHSIKKAGSFHNLYGTRNNTVKQLEEYINMKRLSLCIDIKFSIDEYLKTSNAA